MLDSSEKFVLFIVIFAILIWLFVIFKRWLYAPRNTKLPFLHDMDMVPPRGEAVDLLESMDYEVIHGKHKVPIYMVVDDNEDKPLRSQFFIDYFVQKEGKVYIVKLARERQPLNWSGSSIRDRLLPLFLLYEEVSGVLYVDLNQKNVKKINFELDEDEESRET
jgi:hypothetical protein